MNKKLLHWLALLLIFATGILHYMTAAEAYREARYLGVLFIANFIGSLVAAVGIVRRKLGWGWILGGVIAAGSILGYLQSRTVGMPGMEVETWYDPIGIPALIVETLFLLTLVLARPWSAPVTQPSASSWLRPTDPPVYWSAIALLGIAGFFSLLKAVQIYQVGKDVCGIALAHPSTLFESPTGTKVTLVSALFFIAFLLSLFAAYGIWRRQFWAGWANGVFIPLIAFFGAYQSRMAEVPEILVTDWWDPAGLAILLGGCFLFILFVSKPWAEILNKNSSTPPESRQPVLLASLVVLVITVGVFSYQLGAAKAGVQHPLPAKVISNDTLEQEYGIRLTLVGVTAAGGMVDVRYRVVDPVKAAKLIDPNEGGIMPMVYVGSGDVMLMPDMHMREQQLVAGRVYFVLIPNAQNAVKRGTVVTVVFGNVAVEPTLAQ